MASAEGSSGLTWCIGHRVLTIFATVLSSISLTGACPLSYFITSSFPNPNGSRFMSSLSSSHPFFIFVCDNWEVLFLLLLFDLSLQFRLPSRIGRSLLVVTCRIVSRAFQFIILSNLYICQHICNIFGLFLHFLSLWPFSSQWMYRSMPFLWGLLWGSQKKKFFFLIKHD